VTTSNFALQDFVKPKDKQCIYKRNVEALSCNHCYRGDAINITYSECVSVALVIQHVRCMRRIILSSVTFFLYHVLLHYLINDTIFRKKTDFDVLLTVHLSIFISIINQLDAQDLFHNKFYFLPLHVSSTCAHHQEVKISLHSLLYHHTETSES